MKRIILISGIVLLIYGPAFNCLFSQEVKIRAEIDTNLILAGDQIWFSIIMEKPAELDINLYRYSDTIVRNIEVIRGPERDTVRLEDGFMSVRDRYLITSFDSGRYEIPPVYGEVILESGLKRYYTDYTYLEVRRPDISPADSTMQFFDIVGPYRAPLSAGEILPWVLAGMAAALIAYYALRYFRGRSKKEESITSFEPEEAAHVIAYRSLERLKSEKLWQRSLFKQYYTSLSDIMRLYIDQRFGMNSMESTTGEILYALRSFDYIESEASDLLKQVLELSDLVKFARLVPEASDCELSMEQAWSFVSRTRKVRQAEISDNDEVKVELNDNVTDKEEGGEV